MSRPSSCTAWSRYRTNQLPPFSASAFGSSSRNVRRKGAARLLEGRDVLLARHEAPGEAQGKGGEGQVAPDHDSRSERLLPDRGAEKLQGLRQ
jgi:hypothetical protein